MAKDADQELIDSLNNDDKEEEEDLDEEEDIEDEDTSEGEDEEEEEESISLRHGGLFGDVEDDEEEEPKKKSSKTPVKNQSKKKSVPDNAIEERLSNRLDEIELRSFLAENPDYKKHAIKIREIMQSPQLKSAPIEMIALWVSKKDISKNAVKKARVADDEAKKTKMVGNSNRQSMRQEKTENKSAWDLDDESFEKLQRRVKSGEFSNR